MPEEEKKFEEQIQEDLGINIDELSGELQKQSATYYYYSASWALASRKRRQQKMVLEETKARLGNQLKLEVKEADPKARVSERMLDDYLAEQDEYKKVLRDYIQSEYIEQLLEVAKDAFRQRSQMLNELSRSHSDERFYGNEFKAMQGEMEVRDEKKAKKRSKRTQAQEETNA